MADEVQLFSQLSLLYYKQIEQMLVLCKTKKEKRTLYCALLFLIHFTTLTKPNKWKAGYLNVLHVCVVELFSKMLIFLKKIDDFSEVAVIVESSVLQKCPKIKQMHKPLIDTT